MVLRIPTAGLQLESSGSSKLPQQAIAIRLDDNVIESMIQCVQNGRDIQLSLGSNPALLFGSKTHAISTPRDSHYCDLYQSDPSKSEARLSRLPNPAMAIFPRFGPPAQREAWERSEKLRSEREAKAKTTSKATDVRNVFGTKADDALERLSSQFAAFEENKKQATIVSGIRNGKVGKVLSAGNATRSMPSSPALNGVSSPGLGPNSSTSDRQKRQRMPIIHELAAEPRTEKYLLDVFEKTESGSRQEFKTVLDKVATPSEDDPSLFTLRNRPCRELDIWKYDYATKEDRMRAQDKAIEVYDRMQLGSKEPEWERLLPLKDRGKGICLSRLQKKLARNAALNSAAAPKTQRSSGSQSRSPEPSSTRTSELPVKKLGGEAMARSNSQPVGTKSKKPSERDAQTKRLLGKTSKPAPQRANTPKASTPKISPAKPAAKGSASKRDGRVLSKEFITDSDEESEGEDAPLASKTAANPKTTEQLKVSTPIMNANSTTQKPKSTARPVPVKSEISSQPKKRAREEKEDSSSSEAPLSKRIRPQEQKLVEQKLGERKTDAKKSIEQARPPSNHHTLNKHRPSDSSGSSRSSNGSSNSLPKAKNTSPAKSSPLASSPPTNASDFDSAQDSIIAKTSTNGVKRKAGNAIANGERDEEATKGAKRQKVDSILDMAKRFQTYYPRYEKLHNKLVALENPPAEEVANLEEMHERLQRMKAAIYRDVTAV